MALFEEIRAGSFKGASFFIKSATTEGGRKQIKHEFPNSDKQSIEDLGFKPKVFSITVVTAASYTAEGEEIEGTYFSNRDALIAALEQGGEGVLSHPFFTTDLRTVARPYSLSENVNSLGIATFSLVFDITDKVSAVDPQPDTDALSEINQKTNDVTNQVNEDIADNWFVRTGENLKKGVEIVGDFFDNVKTQTSKVTQITDSINEFNSSIAAVQNDIVAIVQNGQNLADAVVNTIQTTRALYASVDSALDVFIRLFDFGDNIAAVSGNTRNTDEQQVNQDLIINTAGAAYLAQAYQSASVKEYATVDEVDDIKTKLETQFDKIAESEISNDLKTILSDLRVVSNSFLDEQRLTARDVLDINIKEQPIRVLAFANYGEDNNDITDSLIELNDTADISFLGGNVKILSVLE